MTSISEFLANEVFEAAPDALADFARLEGRDFVELVLLSSVEDCQAELTPSTPLYVLPVGAVASFPVGLHLRPEDVAGGRLAFVSLQDETELIEIANSPRHLTVLSLLRMEGFAQEVDDTDMLDEAVAESDDAFGAGFFLPETHGTFTREDAEEIAADEFGTTPAAVFKAALLAESPAERRRVLEAGIAAAPDCMALQAELAFTLAKAGEERGVAEATVAALGRYHHTVFTSDLDGLYEQGRRLLERLPDAFPETVRRDLLTTDERERLLWVTQLYEAGDVELATKLLCDMCHERADYDSVLPIFRKHFERLGWRWPLALIGLRGAG